MIREKIEDVIGKKVVIVCCGNLGKELFDCLIENHIQPECFFDNSIKKMGLRYLEYQLNLFLIRAMDTCI